TTELYTLSLHDALPISMDGLKTEVAGGALQVSWRGERGDQLRAAFTLRNGQPVIAELGVRNVTLARNLTPEFEVTSGKRRLSERSEEHTSELQSLAYLV